MAKSNNKGKDKKNKQRMAGEVWREYDPKGKGGEGFDRKDIRYLQKEGWSHNDIMRAAAASGDVRGNTDQKLRQLNTKTTKARNLPESVLKDMRRHAGITGMTHLNDGEFVFLGGDQNDSSNWQIKGGGPGVGGKSFEANVWNDLGDARIQGWNHKQGNARGGGKHGKSVLTWQGINADGSANAPTGTFSRRNDKGEIKERAITWRLPPDFVASKNAVPATPITDTAKPVEKAPEFDLGDWLKPQEPSGGSGSGSGGGTGGGDSGSGSGGGSVVEPPATETPYEPEGFERIVNRVYNRPSDWVGDVWKPATEGSSTGDGKRRLAGSSSFTDAMDYWQRMSA